jgi:hypothetical protein
LDQGRCSRTKALAINNSIDLPALTILLIELGLFGHVLGVNRFDLSMGLEGLTEYDPDGVDARAIIEIIEGVHVIRLGKYRLTTWLS